MAIDRGLSALDEEFRLARSGDVEAFARWMGMVEIPMRRSLRRFARAVDVEGVVQEALLRMWLVACDPDRPLSGRDASIKFALRVARNVALEEVRRLGQGRFVGIGELDRMPEGSFEAELSDPALGRIIEDCIRRLPNQPRNALRARAGAAGEPDREIAGRLRMRLNTYLQNIVRARRLLADCIEKRGVRLAEILS